MPNNFRSWQFWAAAKKLLGESNLLRILGKRNGRTIRMYSADPKYTVERCRDPLQHLHIIFSELDTFGRGDVARLAIRYLATALDDSDDLDKVAELQPTLDAEVVADYQAVGDLQRAIGEVAQPDVIKDRAAAAKEEIDRTLTKYVQEWGNNGQE